MTERLYYTDPYLSEFEATVIAVEEAGDRLRVWLDRTAFYPTSGGQPTDFGTLANARVVDVVDAEEGGIVHLVDGELAVGATVEGRIDWGRRFDHMQQHTGQHILSAAFDRLLDARTESFHLGADASTIDLAREVSPQEIARAEQDANRIVWEDRPVAIRFVDAAEASRLPLRKESLRSGPLRLIDVDGYDLSACGGTHVARTGAIGVIVVAGWERFRGGTRVEFVCGGRALRRYARMRDTAAAASRLLSVHADEVPAALERLQAEMRDAKRRLKDAQAGLAVHEARRLADAAPDGVVVASLEGWDQNGLKSIASAIVSGNGYVAALLGLPAPYSVVVARSSDRTSPDCAAVLKQLVSRFGGKGGGRADLAQGGGLAGDHAEISSYSRSLLRTSAPL